MFKQNKYTRWYYSIINNRKENPISGYTERHHIEPSALGGSDDENNLVRLTAREHWVCHQLLTRMVEGKARMKMLHPCVLFKKTAGNSRRYQQLKMQRAQAMTGGKHSEETKKKIGDAHRGRKHTPEHVEKTASKKRGVKFTEETCAKMSAAHVGKKHTEETKKKIGDGNRGKIAIVSEEHAKKISLANKGKPKPLDFGQKIREARSHEFVIRCPDGSVETIKYNKNEWAKARGLRLGSLVEKSRQGLSYKGYSILDVNGLNPTGSLSSGNSTAKSTR